MTNQKAICPNRALHLPVRRMNRANTALDLPVCRRNTMLKRPIRTRRRDRRGGFLASHRGLDSFEQAL